MHIKLKLNTIILADFTFDAVYQLLFENIDGITHSLLQNEEDVTKLEIQTTNGSQKTLFVYFNDESIPSQSYTENTLDEVSADRYIIFECDVPSSQYETLLYFIENGIIDVNQDNDTLLAVYKQNSENDVVDKTLTFVTLINGKFNHLIGLKNINIDLVGYEMNFNYVYIPSLKKYYYVDSIEFVSGDITRLHLKEDVLMSWKDLIRNQKAFVTRYEFATNEKIVDERKPLEDVVTIEYLPLTNITTGSKKNITLTTNSIASAHILFSCISWSSAVSQAQGVYAPDSNLPNILEGTHSPIENRYLLTEADLFYLQNAIVKNYNTSTPIDIDSYINSLLWLPFDLITPYESQYIENLTITLTNNTYLKTTNNGEFGTGSTNALQVYQSWLSASPYFVLEDFEIDVPESYLQNKPMCQWEIYIAFLGWIEVDINQINKSRLLIYYTIDEKTGQGTANLFNKTTGKLIYSSNCQIGFKMDWSKTNSDELSREQQTNVTNTILGLLTSAVAIGTGNPLAVTGGVLSAGKTIANAINKKNMMFSHAQTTFGGVDTSIHTPLTT